jgi:Flp pilus assembly pilin Flp
MEAAMGRFLGFIRDGSGASSADYVIILAGLCAALVIAGLFLDNDTQVRLQSQLMGLIGRN